MHINFGAPKNTVLENKKGGKSEEGKNKSRRSENGVFRGLCKCKHKGNKQKEIQKISNAKAKEEVWDYKNWGGKKKTSKEINQRLRTEKTL